MPPRAIDTNVLVRFLIDDGSVQVGRARSAVRSGLIFVSSTVLLETEWVLRSRYAVSAGDIAGLLRDLLDLPNLRMDNRLAVERALVQLADGMDFADALHLHLAAHCESFLTFDARMIKQSQSLFNVPTVCLP